MVGWVAGYVCAWVLRNRSPCMYMNTGIEITIHMFYTTRHNPSLDPVTTGLNKAQSSPVQSE